MYEPKWWPKQWRKVELNEPILKDDFYWSPSKRHWKPITTFSDNFPRCLPIIRRKDDLATVQQHIQILEHVGNGHITGTFSGNPDFITACRFAVLVLEDVPIIIEMVANGCVSGHFNEWPQLKSGCRDVTKTLSM